MKDYCKQSYLDNAEYRVYVGKDLKAKGRLSYKHTAETIVLALFALLIVFLIVN